MRVGVIGLGLGMHHARVYHKNPRAVVAALADLDARWLEHAAEQIGVGKERLYTNYKELLQHPDLDAVSVCLPNFLHAEAAIAALEAGKHVLCEKPMTISLKDAEAMHEASLRTEKKLMISQNQRFEGGSQFLKELADNHFFGEIYFIRTGWRRPMGMLPGPTSRRADGSISNRNWFNERSKGGGVLRDLGSHMLDYSLYLTGFPKFQGAYGSCYRKFYPEGYGSDGFTVDSEDHAMAHIKFENGLSIQLEVNFGSHIEEEVVFTEVYGTKGGASKRNGVLKLFTESAGYVSSTVVKPISRETKGVIDRFVDCVVDDTKPPVPSEQGVELIRIIEAIYESAGFVAQ